MSEQKWRRLIARSAGLLMAVMLLCIVCPEKQEANETEKDNKAEKIVISNKVTVDKANSEEKTEKKTVSIVKKNPKKIVVIDAGHGGTDNGAIIGKHSEKDYTLQVTKELKKFLDKSDITAYYTRMKDETLSKKDRAKLANKLKADMFISIHCNYTDGGKNTASGIEALYSKRKCSSKKLSNKKLAAIVSKNLSDILKARNRGVKQREELYLMRHSKVPTTIIEIGYLNSDVDYKNIKSSEGRKKIAQGIYNSIEQAYKVKNK